MTKKPVKITDIPAPSDNELKVFQAERDLGHAVSMFLECINSKKMTHVSLGKKRDGSSFLFTMNTTDGRKVYASGSDIASLGEDISYALIEFLGSLAEEGEGIEEDELPF